MILLLMHHIAAISPVAFKPISNDLSDHVKKIRGRQSIDAVQSQTLQELVKNEIKSGSHAATEALASLVRYDCAMLCHRFAPNKYADK